MKKVLMVIVCAAFCLLYGNTDADFLANQETVTSFQNAQTEAVIEQMDAAKASGDYGLFKQLREEYKRLNPPAVIEECPQGQIMGPEPSLTGSTAPTFRWDGDVTVDSAWDYQAFSMDTRDDGFIFLAAARESLSATEYRIPIWYSSDGENWTLYYNIFWYVHDCRNPSVKVVEQSDSSYLFVIFDGINTSTNEEDVWVLRHAFGSTDWDYYVISELGGIGERDPSTDADDIQYTSAAYLYTAFENADSIAFMRSLDLGLTWTSRTIIGNGGTSWDYVDPSCAFGWYASADSFTVGVAWTYNHTSDEDHMRFRKCAGFGIDWLPIEYFSGETGHNDGRPALKMTHGTTPSGTIIFARHDTTGTDEEDLCDFFTYNGARDWGTDTLYFGGTYSLLTTLAVDDAANDYHGFFNGDDGTIRYKEAHYDDFSYEGWTFSMQINDGGLISSSTYPASAVLNDEPCVCWKDITNSTWYKIMFDALWLTGIEEKPGQEIATLVSLAPNPSRGETRLSYATSTQGEVRISLYDAAGRLVTNLVNEVKPAGKHAYTMSNLNLAAGVYFVRIETVDTKVTKKLTLIR